MDSGRFLLAIVLMIAVIVVTNLLFPPAPPREPGAAQVGVADTVAADTVPTAVAGVPAPRPEVAPAPDAPADTIVIESPLYRYGISTRGGGIVRAELLEFQSFSRPGAVDLVPADADPLIGYRLRVGDEVVDLGRLPFRIRADGSRVLEPGGGPDTLRLAYDAPEGAFGIDLEYIFEPDRYVIDVRGRIRGLGAAATPLLLLDLGPTLAVNEADPEEDYRALAYVVNSTERGIRSVNLDDVDAERIEEGPLVWAAIKNKYFLAAVLSSEEGAARYFGGLIASPVAREHAADLTATLPLGRDHRFSYQLYLGPQEYDQLAALGRGLEDANPYGWRVLRPIIRPLAHLITWAVVGLHNVLGVGYGWVLILFGLLVRALLWPLNAKAMRSQLKNMALQPVVKEIQQKYKSDPERMQKEMLRLYREEGFNPLGGCLPILIPFPVLITLFFVFQSTIEFRGVEFLWLPDLSRPDPYYILPIILGLSMFVLQWISARSMPATNPQMKMMMWFMPAFMVIIFLNLASGLNLYYAASNVATVPQQVLLMKERRRAAGAMGRS